MGKLSISKLIGGGYNHGWFTNCQDRYRCYKGARNTKKSVDILGYEILFKILSSPYRNVLIVRQTFSTHKYSTYSTLVGLIQKPDVNQPELSLSKYFNINKSDLTITYIPTGQVILFRGNDDAQKIQGIRVVYGFLTDIYFEEAFEFKDYEEIRKIDGSLRGKLPEGVFFQITFCFNAWNKNHWLYEVFFKGRLEDDFDYLDSHDYAEYEDSNYLGAYGKGIYLHISTYKINEFRDPVYDEVMENLKIVAPDIYKVEALGMWGNSTGATYRYLDNILMCDDKMILEKPINRIAIGIDTGLSNGEGKINKTERVKSATVAEIVGLTYDYNELVYLDEFWYSNEQEIVKKTEPELYQDICVWLINAINRYPMLLAGQTLLIYVDCADIGFRDGLRLKARELGIDCIVQPSTKLPIRSRVDFFNLMCAYKNVKINNSCKNVMREMRNSHIGEKGEAREDFDDHAINAGEYAWASFANQIKQWKTFKQRS